MTFLLSIIRHDITAQDVIALPATILLAIAFGFGCLALGA